MSQGTTNPKVEPTPPILFWELKPWWCQPWSILLTGGLVIGASLFSYQRYHISPWLIGPVLFAVFAWWLLFLVIVPGQYK